MKSEIEINFKMNMKKWIIIFYLFLVTSFSWAQQDPMFTQYNFNTQSFNPAYTGTWETMGFMVLGRYQWVGMNGAPNTYTFSMQSHSRNLKVGLGFDLVMDQIGKEKRLSLMGDYSYRLRVSSESFLRMGLKFGVVNYSNLLSSYVQDPDSPNDPLADGEIDFRYMPNFGIGAFLYSKDYYIGFSIPKMLNNQFKNNYANFSTEAEFRQFFLQAGLVINLSDDLKFKPTFLTKATVGAPVEFDFTGNFLLKEQIWLGAMYRTGASFGFIAQWIFDKRLRIGYAIDFSTNQLQQYHDGTHEIMVSYELGYKNKWVSPRMF